MEEKKNSKIFITQQNAFDANENSIKPFNNNFFLHHDYDNITLIIN